MFNVVAHFHTLETQIIARHPQINRFDFKNAKQGKPFFSENYPFVFTVPVYAEISGVEKQAELRVGFDKNGFIGSSLGEWEEKQC